MSREHTYGKLWSPSPLQKKIKKKKSDSERNFVFHVSDPPSSVFAIPGDRISKMVIYETSKEQQYVNLPD